MPDGRISRGLRAATKKAFELNREYRAKFVEDKDFDAVWRTVSGRLDPANEND